MKKILFAIAALSLTLPMMAQWDDVPDVSQTQTVTLGVGAPKKNAFFLGPKAGVTFGMMSQPEQADLYDGMGVGFSGGLAMKLRFGKATEDSDGGTGLLGLGIEVKYVQNNVKLIGGEKLSMGFVEMPITFQIYPFKRSSAMNGFMIEVGPDFAYNITRSPEVVTANNYVYKVGDLKSHDIRALVGLGYTIPRTGLDINARYYMGFSKMAENMNSKMSYIEVSLSYLFRVAKF